MTNERQPRKRLGALSSRRAIVCSALVASLAAPAAAQLPANGRSGGSEYVFVLDSRAGPYRYLEALKKGRSYPAAVTAFGLPSSRRPDGNLCVVRWAAFGIDVRFASRPGACSLTNLRRGAWYGMRIWGARWRTFRGLRIGDSAQRVPRLYPKARFHDDPGQTTSYWLATWQLEPGAAPSPLLEAEIRGGRVSAVVVHAGYIY